MQFRLIKNESGRNARNRAEELNCTYLQAAGQSSASASSRSTPAPREIHIYTNTRSSQNRLLVEMIKRLADSLRAQRALHGEVTDDIEASLGGLFRPKKQS
ncbi:hypothetical protein EVAR_78604_1 [Eumeta japonica]|uniref:Uncharacterized protein n=1 Tax=Eumeta variegata TaxID=151549 RepID=A0A4C1U7Z4_EUMVA|nr:hypothetical protein EVAR_78604_1 [Eumeta japonica]